MKYAQRPAAMLLLEDGTQFNGFAIGKQGTTGGELCFNTGMTGYQEIYTDPSYYGQIVLNSTAHIGNYGTVTAEVESSSVQIKGLVVKTFSDIFSRQTATESLQSYLEKANIVGISDIDTRQLVKHIRDKGAMNAVISSEFSDTASLQNYLKTVPNMAGLELASIVSTKVPYFLGNPNAKFKVAVIDYGIKQSILTNLVNRDIYCQVFPAKTDFATLQAWNPDGYFLSNGPGDPATMNYAIETAKSILKTEKPLFGICLGHQILAIAVGLETYKMHTGHRGLNHAVKNLITGKCEITSQNHGFAVSAESINNNSTVELTHLNLNDNTVEGLRLKNGKAFSVQYHPEAAPGPHDAQYLFDDFLALLKTV
jgi:carbamoyl-phosphate synthase small subunit